MRAGKEIKRERAVKSLELRIAGGTYRQIGKQLGVSEKTAYYDVQDELGRLDAVKLKQAERLRDLELERLDKAIVGLLDGIRKGDPRSVQAYVKISERRAKLLGLDAPAKTDLNIEGALTIDVARQAQEAITRKLARLAADRDANAVDAGVEP